MLWLLSCLRPKTGSHLGFIDINRYIGNYQFMNDETYTALANAHRRQLLYWLKEPRKHFPPCLPEHRDLPGVCASYIFAKSELSQPTVSQYLHMLERVGLVKRARHGRWTFFSRHEEGIAQAQAGIIAMLEGRADG